MFPSPARRPKAGTGVMSMATESDFEAQLRADGFSEIETQSLDPRPGKGRHRHLFSTADSYCPGRSWSQRMPSRSYTEPARCLRSPRGNCTMNRSGRKALASWSDANIQLRNRPPADRRGVLPTLSLGRSLAHHRAGELGQYAGRSQASFVRSPSRAGRDC